MKLTIELTDQQIAQAFISQDYPDQARTLDVMGIAMKLDAEDDDKYYRWTRHLVKNLDVNGVRFIKDLGTAIKDAGL